MNKFLPIIVAIVLNSCSLDNKTGIWKDASNIPLDNQDVETISNSQDDIRYEDVNLKNETYNKEKAPLNFDSSRIIAPIKIISWPEQYGISSNNISNFSYGNKKNLLSKSRKLSKANKNKHNSNQKIIFYKKNLISHDSKGTIFIYSLSSNKKIFEYNFYKKNFKKFNKQISLIVNKNTLYAADNLGYLYAFNLNNNTIKWAKNFGIPFRSNLKFANNQIFVASQDNIIHSIDSTTGSKNWQFATSPTALKSDFENNFALDLINNNLLFLNTSGELYSINYETKKINWVLNFKNASLTEDTNLFFSQPLVIISNNVIVATEKSLLNYDILTSKKNWTLNAELVVKPVVNMNYTYAILKNNLLICVDNINGNVIWSKNIFTSLYERKLKNNFKSVVDFKIVNSEINIYTNNGYLLSFDLANGKLNNLNRISKKGISSKIVFLDENMLFIDRDNKLLKFN